MTYQSIVSVSFDPLEGRRMFKRARFMILLCMCIALTIALQGCGEQKASTQTAKTESFAEQITNDKADEHPSMQNDASLEKSRIAQDLEAQFQAIANSTSMKVSISFVDLEQPQNSCSFDGDVPIRSASTIKLMVLYELLHQAHEGMLSLDGTYTLTSSDIVGGTGILQNYGAGYVATYRELAELMINRSDNVATNVLIDTVGRDNINARAAELGLSSIQLNRHMMDTNALAAGIDNYLSSADATALLAMVYDGSFVDPQMSAFALEALKSQTDDQGILAGLPAGTAFAHKTGTLSNAQNDCGIVLGDHPYAVAVFCEADGASGYFSANEAFNIMARVGRSVTEALGR